TNREMRQVLRVGVQMERQLPLLAEKLATTLDALSEASAQIRDTARKNGDALHEVLVEVPGLVRDGGAFVREGQDVVGAARNSWFLRDLIEAKSVRTLPLDSFESAGPGGAGAQR